MSSLLSSILVVASVAASGARADTGDVGVAKWKIETGTDTPSYAAVEPTRTNPNIGMVVLACVEAGEDRVLQLQLYLTDDGPLRHKSVRRRPLRNDPRTEISIDGRVYAVALLFAGDYVVLADTQRGPYPLLSDQLVSAMQSGKSMIVRFSLLAGAPGRMPSFDGEAVVELEGGGGHKAIAALRRCAKPTAKRPVGMVLTAL